MALSKVMEFKEVTLDYEATGGTATFNIYTDLPGGAVVQRTITGGGTMPAATRRTITFPLDGIEGTLYKAEVVPASGATAKLFGGTIRFRPIGTYLDGSRSEKWVTQPIALGV